MRLVHAGRTLDARVRQAKDGIEVVLTGRLHRLDVRHLSGGAFESVQGGRREVFHCVRDGDNVYLHFGGWSYELQLEREGARSTHRPVTGTLEAPMPGKVIEVSVEVGQEVRKGDRILVIEAMKMENQLRAPKAGRIRSLAASVGDTVGPGLVLAEIE